MHIFRNSKFWTLLILSSSFQVSAASCPIGSTLRVLSRMHRYWGFCIPLKWYRQFEVVVSLVPFFIVSCVLHPAPPHQPHGLALICISISSINSDLNSTYLNTSIYCIRKFPVSKKDMFPNMRSHGAKGDCFSADFACYLRFCSKVAVYIRIRGCWSHIIVTALH